MAKNPTNDQQQTIYNQVITSFGTHYVSSAIMGGTAKVFSSFNKTYIETQDDRQVKNDLSLNFKYLMFEFTFGYNSSDMTTHPTKEFMDNVASDMIFSPVVEHTDAESKPWANWENNVPLNP